MDIEKLKRHMLRRQSAFPALVIAGLFACGGWLYAGQSGAATYVVNVEAESGARMSGAQVVTDVDASTGSAVRFTAATPTSGRPSTLHPFTSDAYSNTSVGSGIQTDPASPMTAAVKVQSAAFNSARWSFPIFVASASDPVFDVTVGSRTFTMQIPESATAAAGTDAHMNVIQPDKRTDYEMWGATRTATGGWTARYVVKTDLLTTGMTAGARASGISHLHGVIRKEEVAALHIPHTLAMGLAREHMKVGPVWPARLQDSGADGTYLGPVPMGTMFVIPMDADTDALNLSPQGKALAWTLKNYGAHVLLASATVSLYAETAAEAQYPQEIRAMRSDWPKLRNLLVVVTNNTQANVAGGGTRYQPTLPPVVAE